MAMAKSDPRWRTTMCRHWNQDGYCSYGNRCHFAHGEHELRPFGGQTETDRWQRGSDAAPSTSHPFNSSKAPHFKTSLCWVWQRDPQGCKYGASCVYAHGEAELRPKQDSPSPMTRQVSAPAPQKPAFVPPKSSREAEQLVKRAMEEGDTNALRVGLEYLAREEQKRRRGDVRPKSAHELLAEHELEAEGRGKEQDEEDEREEDGDSDSERREQEGSGDGSAGSPQDGSKQASGGKPAPWRRMQLLLPRQQLASYLSAAVVTYASPEMTREVLRLWNKQEHGCWTLLLSAGPLGTGTAGAAGNAGDGNGVAGQGGGGDAEVGHKCVLLHDLVRQAFAPVPSVPVQSVMDAVRVITGVRPGAVLDQDQEGRIALSVALRGCASDAGAALGSKGSQLAVLLAPLTYFMSENACLVQEATLDWAYKSQVWEEAAVKPLVGQVEAWFEDRKRKQAQAKEQDEMQRNGSASLPPARSGSFSTAATAAAPRPAAATPAAAQAPSAAAPAPPVPPPLVPQRPAGPPPPVATGASAVGPAPQAPSPRQPTAGPPGFPGGPRPTAAPPPGFPSAGPHMAPLPAGPYPGPGGPYQASSHPAPHPGGPYPGGPYPGAMYHPGAPPPPYPGGPYPGGPHPGHPAPVGYPGGPPMPGPFMGPPPPYMQPGPAARMPPGFGPAPESVAPGGAMPPVAVVPVPMPPPMIIRPVIQTVLPHLPRPPPPAVMMPPPGTAPSAQAHPQA